MFTSEDDRHQAAEVPIADDGIVVEAEPLPATSACIDVVPFCVSLPATASDGFGGDDSLTNAEGAEAAALGSGPASKQLGVVGTVTFLADRSAMVWFGWGDLIPAASADECGDAAAAAAPGEEESDGSSRLLGSGVPVMGPLALSMPRTKYGGGKAEEDPACTQLIGGNSEEDMVVGCQVASRLTRKVGWPVYVSCALHAGAATASEQGMMGAGFGGSLSQRAAAMAEREVGRILMRRKQEKSSS